MYILKQKEKNEGPLSLLSSMLKQNKGILFICVFLISTIAGCNTLKKITQPHAQTGNLAAITTLPDYSGPKANIAVADFEIKAVKAGSETASGLKEMLVTTLVNSNRFSVVERQTIATVAQEQKSVASEALSSQAARSPSKNADLIITAAIIEFEPQASGGRAGVGGGGGVGSGVLGALLSTGLNKAHIALEIRVVDAFTSKVLAASQIQGQASDISGVALGGISGGSIMGRGLLAYANTPMEKAIRICIAETVRYISRVISVGYYRY